MSNATAAVDWTRAPVFGSVPEGVTAIVRPSAYALLVDDAGSFAVVRTPLGLYLPGGGIDPGESPFETVLRECQEECGLEATVGNWIGRAIEIVWSPNDRVYYEKHSTFVDAQCSAHRGAGIEPDHALEWMTVPGAIAELRDASHRWAVSQWASRA